MDKIAVTGVGGGVGQSILKSLRDSGYDIVAMDGDRFGAGLYASARSYIIPYANNPEYIPRILEILKKESCDLLFPGLDAELPHLAKNRHEFQKIGTTVVVSGEDVIEIADNKWLTYRKLTEWGISAPMTQPLEDYTRNPQIRFPLILKPMKGGARSKDVFLVKNKERMEYVSRHLISSPTDFVAQEYIEGDEYTCGSINFDGTCHGVIVMRRILRDGDTYKAFVERNEAIETCVRDLMSRLKPFGACNAQIRLRNNVPYVFEINARCSGTTAARALAGFNEPKMIADYLLKNIKPSYSIRPISVLRYWNELAVESEQIDRITKTGSLSGGSSAL